MAEFNTKIQNINVNQVENFNDKKVDKKICGIYILSSSKRKDLHKSHDEVDDTNYNIQEDQKDLEDCKSLEREGVDKANDSEDDKEDSLEGTYDNQTETDNNAVRTEQSEQISSENAANQELLESEQEKFNELQKEWLSSNEADYQIIEDSLDEADAYQEDIDKDNEKLKELTDGKNGQSSAAKAAPAMAPAPMAAPAQAAAPATDGMGGVVDNAFDGTGSGTKSAYSLSTATETQEENTAIAQGKKSAPAAPLFAAPATGNGTSMNAPAAPAQASPAAGGAMSESSNDTAQFENIKQDIETKSSSVATLYANVMKSLEDVQKVEEESTDVTDEQTEQIEDVTEQTEEKQDSNNFVEQGFQYAYQGFSTVNQVCDMGIATSNASIAVGSMSAAAGAPIESGGVGVTGAGKAVVAASSGIIIPVLGQAVAAVGYLVTGAGYAMQGMGAAMQTGGNAMVLAGQVSLEVSLTGKVGALGGMTASNIGLATCATIEGDLSKAWGYAKGAISNTVEGFKVVAEQVLASYTGAGGVLGTINNIKQGIDFAQNAIGMYQNIKDGNIKGAIINGIGMAGSSLQFTGVGANTRNLGKMINNGLSFYNSAESTFTAIKNHDVIGMITGGYGMMQSGSQFMESGGKLFGFMDDVNKYVTLEKKTEAKNNSMTKFANKMSIGNVLGLNKDANNNRIDKYPSEKITGAKGSWLAWGLEGFRAYGSVANAINTDKAGVQNIKAIWSGNDGAQEADGENKSSNGHDFANSDGATENKKKFTQEDLDNIIGKYNIGSFLSRAGR